MQTCDFTGQEKIPNRVTAIGKCGTPRAGSKLNPYWGHTVSAKIVFLERKVYQEPDIKTVRLAYT